MFHSFIAIWPPIMDEWVGVGNKQIAAPRNLSIYLKGGVARKEPAFALALSSNRTHSNPLVGKSRNPAPDICASPDAAPQCFQLDDLAVIDKQVHVRPKILHVPT